MSGRTDGTSSQSTSSGSSGNLFFQLSRSFLVYTKITVEPIMFIYFLAYALTDALNTNILLSRTCLISFNYTKEDCSGDISPDVEKVIQTYTTKIVMTKTIIESLMTSTISLFLGPWTDSNGRKLFLILPLIGSMIYYLIWLVLSLIPNVPPYYFMFAYLPSSICGGLTILFTCVFCYITDITTERNRAFRMTVTALSLTFGVLAGYLFTTVLIRAFPNYYSTATYSTAVIAMFVLILYVHYFVPETIMFVEGGGEKCKILTFYHVKEMLKTLVMKRPKFGRVIFCIITFMIGIDVIILQGEVTFRYLALKKIFGWTMDEYNVYSAVLCFSSIIASTLGMWLLNKVLKFSEMWISFLVSIVSVVSSAALIMSENPLDFYLAANLGVLVTILNPVLKSEIAKIFPSKDTGKAFSFLSTFEALTPFAASASYTIVYNKVVAFRPQNIYYLSAILWLIVAFGSIVIIIIKSQGVAYDVLKQEEDERNFDAARPNDTNVNGQGTSTY